MLLTIYPYKSYLENKAKFQNPGPVNKEAPAKQNIFRKKDVMVLYYLFRTRAKEMYFRAF